MHAIKRLLGRDDESCQREACKEERLREADRRLDDQAKRLDVLEWETYGRSRSHQKGEGG